MKTIDDPSDLQIVQAMLDEFTYVDGRDLVVRAVRSGYENGNRIVRAWFKSRDSEPGALQFCADFNGSMGDLILAGLDDGRLCLSIPGDGEEDE